MGDIVLLDAARRDKDVRLDELWNAYLAARDKADQTRDIADGIAAGKAWAAWVIPFTGRAS